MCEETEHGGDPGEMKKQESSNSKIHGKGVPNGVTDLLNGRELPICFYA